jgi:AcrR family transcriptional regulator
MARPKEFDVEAAVDAAIGVFREHGYEGTSAQMLVDAMGIGRQSLYDTFGDKWGVYCAALHRYCEAECRAHREELQNSDRAVLGIRRMFERVVSNARQNCLGLHSIIEFGCADPDVVAIRARFGKFLHEDFIDTLTRAKEQGDVRISARGGASPAHLSAIVDLSLRAVR